MKGRIIVRQAAWKSGGCPHNSSASSRRASQSRVCDSPGRDEQPRRRGAQVAGCQGIKDPADVNPAIRGRELPEVGARQRVGIQGPVEVRRDSGREGVRIGVLPRTAFRAALMARKARFGHPVLSDKPSGPSPVDLRPDTAGPARGPALPEPVPVNRVHTAVNPAEAERLIQRVRIAQAGELSVFLVTCRPTRHPTGRDSERAGRAIRRACESRGRSVPSRVLRAVAPSGPGSCARPIIGNAAAKSTAGRDRTRCGEWKGQIN